MRKTFVSFLWFFFLLGCQKPPMQNQPILRPFQFDPDEISELIVSKEDWTARFQKDSNKTWKIQSAPQDDALVDQLADSLFIRHLLSTITTLEIAQIEINKSKEALGLSQPRFALQWKTPQKTLQLYLQQSYALIPHLGSHPVKVKGAALAMLERIEKFETLRHRRLATQTSDDVYEYEVYSGLKKVFFAQRKSGGWANEKSLVYKIDLTAWLEQILHLRILEFEDHIDVAKRIFERIKKLPTYRVVFRDRHSNASELAVGLYQGSWWAICSTRPDAAFRIAPEAIRVFLPPRIKQRGFGSKS